MRGSVVVRGLSRSHGPTNHLDLEAIEELESALAEFDGAVVLVTHDRRLLAAFGPTRTVDLGA
jgi:ATPase subunit of ABC transporter with duplicated ATPase domains